MHFFKQKMVPASSKRKRHGWNAYLYGAGSLNCAGVLKPISGLYLIMQHALLQLC
jgi:hypothetical protein